MTTLVMQRLCECQHVARWGDKGYVVFNPHNKHISELPVIYGFNNGGPHGWEQACLVAEDGVFLGDHVCSSEAYMPYDLSMLEGSQPDRQETFRKHYPNGYRMEFVRYDEVVSHKRLNAVLELIRERI